MYSFPKLTFMFKMDKENFFVCVNSSFNKQLLHDLRMWKIRF